MSFPILLQRFGGSVWRRIKAHSIFGTRVPLYGATIHHTRRVLAAAYLTGDGIEIGALNGPLIVPRRARVKYVDRMNATELRKQYPELVTHPLARPDIVDDGETLSTVGAATQDFVIANHF